MWHSSPLAEVGDRVLRPLIRLGEQHPVVELLVQSAAELLEEGVGLGQVLAVGSLPLVQIRDRVQPEPVHPEAQPEIEGGEHRLVDVGVVEVEIGLMGVKPVPVVRARLRVPGPVGALEVLEDDPGLGVAVRIVAPDVEVPRPRPGARPPGPLEPRVLVGGVVDHQLGDHLEPPPVSLAQKDLEVLQAAVGRVDVVVIGDVVAVVPERATG